MGKKKKKRERDYLAWKEWLFGGPDGGSRRETSGGIGIGVNWWLALVTGGGEIYSIKEEEESHGGVVAH